MKVNILAIGAHPDDVELGCAGTLLKSMAQGQSVGILDLTQGELGTRGTAETRLKEATDASKILGITIRENLGFADGFFQNDKAHQLELIKLLRHYQPDIVLCNAIHDRHPDHARAAALVEDAVFLAGLPKVETIMKGKAQEAYRPNAVYHYIQALDISPAFAIDVTEYFDQKIKSVLAYRSQFYNDNSGEPATFISSPEFLEFVRSRASHFGVPIGVRYAEAFTVKRHIGVKDLMAIF